jgi:hypothetical protein
MNSTDYVPPVLTMVGNSVIQVAQYTNYTDFGATAVDNLDGNIPR